MTGLAVQELYNLTASLDVVGVQGARERLQALGRNERVSVPSMRLALAAEAAAQAAAAAANAPGSAAKRMCDTSPTLPCAC